MNPTFIDKDEFGETYITEKVCFSCMEGTTLLFHRDYTWKDVCVTCAKLQN